MRRPRRLRRLRPLGIAIGSLVMAGIALAVSGATLVGPSSEVGSAPANALGAQAAPAPTASPAQGGLGAPALDSPPGPTPAPPIAAPAPTPLPTAELSSTLAALRRKYGIPGVQATVIWPDGRAWSAASGYANLAGGVRATRATPFSVGSITKTFVAALILQLAEEGRLALDQPAVTGVTVAKVRRTVTIRELLQHTSGVYDFFSNPLIDPALQGSPRRVWTPATVYRYVKTPYFEPGEGWRYSNTNYVLLGRIAERITGRPLAVELRQRFFDPLKLTSTIFQGVEQPRVAVAHAYTFKTSSVRARAIDQSDGTGIVPFTSVTTAAGAAGAIATTSWDLARWARALYGGRVLRPESLAVMLDPSAAAPYDPSVPYGLGVQEPTIRGRPSYGHSGRLIGTRAVMRYFPVEGFTIAVTTNQWRSNPDAIVGALLDIVAPPLPPAPAPLPTPTLPPFATPTPTPFSTPTPTPFSTPTPTPFSTPAP